VQVFWLVGENEGDVGPAVLFRHIFSLPFITILALLIAG